MRGRGRRESVCADRTAMDRAEVPSDTSRQSATPELARVVACSRQTRGSRIGCVSCQLGCQVAHPNDCCVFCATRWCVIRLVRSVITVGRSAALGCKSKSKLDAESMEKPRCTPGRVSIDSVVTTDEGGLCVCGNVASARGKRAAGRCKRWRWQRRDKSKSGEKDVCTHGRTKRRRR